MQRKTLVKRVYFFKEWFLNFTKLRIKTLVTKNLFFRPMLSQFYEITEEILLWRDSCKKNYFFEQWCLNFIKWRKKNSCEKVFSFLKNIQKFFSDGKCPLPLVYPKLFDSKTRFLRDNRQKRCYRPKAVPIGLYCMTHTLEINRVKCYIAYVYKVLRPYKYSKNREN